MANRTPRLHRISFNVAPGAEKNYKDNDVGVQRAVFLPSGIMAQNPFLRFGPTGVEFQINTTQGVFIQFDEDFDEINIRVPVGAAGNAVGDVLLSACSLFVMNNV